MAEIAIIGGTGLATLKNLEIRRREVMRSPYGEPSGPLLHGELGNTDVVFLPRHGRGHTIPPHMVNYRANIWALRETGVQKVIAVAAVGGIRQDMEPGRLAFPDQLIDYTWSRMHTYFEQDLSHVTHVDFTDPYFDANQSLVANAGTDITAATSIADLQDFNLGAAVGNSVIPSDDPWDNDMVPTLWEYDDQGNVLATDIEEEIPTKHTLLYCPDVNNDGWIGARGRKLVKGRYQWQALLLVPTSD